MNRNDSCKMAIITLFSPQVVNIKNGSDISRIMLTRTVKDVFVNYNYFNCFFNFFSIISLDSAEKKSILRPSKGD